MPRWVLSVGPPARSGAAGEILRDFGAVPVVVSARGRPPIGASTAGHRCDKVSPRIELIPDGRTIRLTLPLLSHERVFCRQDRDGVSLANDPRILRRPSDPLSAKGLLGLLTLGVLIPPLSVWDEIVQLPPGFTYTISVPDLRMARLPLPGILDGLGPAGGSIDDDVCDALDSALDALLPGDRVKVLFSGGVDSSLLAARLANRPGRRIELIHSQTSPDSLDTRYARAIAEELGLPIRIVPYDGDLGLEACATHLADNYLPYTDFAGVAMLQLLSTVTQTASHDGSPIVDGAGADGAFDSAASLRRMAMMSSAPRRVFAPAWRVYARHRLWKRPRWRAARTLRRLAKLSVVDGPLRKLVYHPFPLADAVDASSFREIESDVHEWVAEAGRGLSPHLRHGVLSLVGNNSGSCFSFADRHDLAAVFPFMHPDVLGVALRDVAGRRPWDSEEKGPLKRLLGRHVSAGLIDRPKRGFTYPPLQTFANPRFLASFDELLDDESHPIFDVVQREELTELRGWVETRQPMSWFAYGFAWTCVTAHRWIEHAATC